MNKEQQKEWLEKQMFTFIGDLKEACDKSFDKFYIDYLPFLENDYESNVKSFAEREVKAFLEGKPESWCHKIPLNEYSGVEIRAKILDEHKSELIPLLNQDLFKEVKSLRIQLQNANRRY